MPPVSEATFLKLGTCNIPSFSKKILNGLMIKSIAVNQHFRIYPDRFRDTPLGIKSSSSRFCSKNFPFSVLYLAANLETAFVEAVVRNKFDRKSRTIIRSSELSGYRIAEVKSSSPLNVIDLTGTHMVRDRLHYSIVGHTDQRAGRTFSRKLKETLHNVDGIRYPSRLVHDQECLAI